MRWLLGSFLALAACRPAPATNPPAPTATPTAATETPQTPEPESEPQANAHPQDPKPPFPYASEDVDYTNPASGLKLAATLTVPQGDGPHPAVVLISGSGPQDRDGSLFGHRPFAVIADALTRRGIAVLRVDDRGMGESERGPLDVTSADFATDVVAGVAFLRSRPEVDPARIGLVGHSEGGMIAPMVAAEDPKLAGIVLLAGPGVPGKELLIAQTRALLEAKDVGGPIVDKAVEQQTQVMTAIAEASSVEEARERVLEVVGSTSSATRKAVEGQVIAWTLYFVQYDPRPALQNVKCPVLALGGSRDTQVLSSTNLEGIGAALAAGGNQAVTTRELDGLNHLFQPATRGTPDEYANSTVTFDEGALGLIGDWLLENL